MVVQNKCRSQTGKVTSRGGCSAATDVVRSHAQPDRVADDGRYHHVLHGLAFELEMGAAVGCFDQRAFVSGGRAEPERSNNQECRG